MNTLLYYTIEVKDRQGKLLSRERRRSRSFVEQYNRFINFFAEATDKVIVDTGGTSRTLDRDTNAASKMRINAAANSSDAGIVVGTGTTAVAIANRALATQILEGISTGQLTHGAVTIGSPSVSAPDCSFTATRIFTNGSGATITVKEIGIYVWDVDTGSIVRHFCIIRDVLAATQDVPDGGAITVVYTIKVTV